MKKHVLLAYGLLFTLFAIAQDSTRSRIGFRSWGDISFLNNNSLLAIRDRLQQTGLDVSGIQNRPYVGGLSFLRDYRKSIDEIRLLQVISGHENLKTSALNKQATFYGYGVGFTGTIKVINTRRFIIGPTLGYDFMWYRIRILPLNNTNLSLNNVVANPALYNTTTFQQGIYMNIQAAISADYRFYWLKKFYDEFRIGARVGYQLPLLRSRNWKYDDGTIGDLPGFKSNSLFIQYGITIIPKTRVRRQR